MHINEPAKIRLIPGGNQMSLIRDSEEVLKFLEFASKKSLLNQRAVNCRLTACHNLFSVVNEEEDQLDYMLTNLDVLTNRFRNKNTQVQASTLKVYKSRVKSSLEEYKTWCDDPFAWERALSQKAKATKVEPTKEKKIDAAPKKKIKEETVASAIVQTTGEYRKVSLPIRTDFNLEISIPKDGLTLQELHRLGLFLYPYCKDISFDSAKWPGVPLTN